jgi:hypothetical protein
MRYDFTNENVNKKTTNVERNCVAPTFRLSAIPITNKMATLSVDSAALNTATLFRRQRAI